MLENRWVTTALYVHPDIAFTIDTYKRKLQQYFSYDYNTGVHTAREICEKIFETNERIEKLSILSNAIRSSTSFLNDKQKEVIDLCYFKRMKREEIINKLQITDKEFKNIRLSAIKKLAVYLNMLGFSNERFLDYFNDEPIVVLWYEQVLEMRKKAKHLITRYRVCDRQRKDA